MYSVSLSVVLESLQRALALAASFWRTADPEGISVFEWKDRS